MRVNELIAIKSKVEGSGGARESELRERAVPVAGRDKWRAWPATIDGTSMPQTLKPGNPSHVY